MKLTSRYSQIKNDEWDTVLNRDELNIISAGLEYFILRDFYNPKAIKRQEKAKEIIDEIKEVLE